MEKNKFIQVGGSIEKAVVGDYSLDVKAILTEGWGLTKTTKLPLLIALLIVLVIGMVFITIASGYMGGIEAIVEDPNKQLIINLFSTVVIAPFIAGIEMMGVSHAVGIKTKSSFVFAFLKRSAFTALTALIIASLTSLGMYLLIPGIYLSVALSLTIPLVVEKNMSPIDAIVLSLKATRFQWFKLFQIYGILIIVFLISLLPIGAGIHPLIGLTVIFTGMMWLAPLLYNVKGILYREIFGLKIQVTGDNNNSDNSNNPHNRSNSDKPDDYFSA